MRKAHGCHRPSHVACQAGSRRGFGLSEATVRKPRNMTPTLLGSPSQRRFAARPFIPLHRARAKPGWLLTSAMLQLIPLTLPNRCRLKQQVARAHRGGIPRGSSFTLPSVRSHMAA